MKRDATIKQCEQRDRDPSKPATDQKFCLFTKDGKRLLGRHSTEEAALEQEKAIHARGGSVRTKMSYIKLAEVPESAVKSLYNEQWGAGIMKQLGQDFPIDSKAAQFLFFSVWNAVIQLMDRVLEKQLKVDTVEFSKDPTFMQSLAGLAYFVTDDAIKSSLGVKSDSLQKGAGHAEALMQVIGQDADVTKTLQGLKQQAEPIVEKAFDRVTQYLKEQPAEQSAEQKAAAAKPATNRTRAELFCAAVRQAAEQEWLPDVPETAPLMVDEVMEFYRDADEAAVALLVDRYNEGVRPRDAEKFLREADRVLENFGVEALDLGSDGERWQLDWDELIIADYSNTGDTYHPTFLWDIANQTMLFTSWGDFLEQWEQNRREELGDEYQDEEAFYGAAVKTAGTLDSPAAAKKWLATLTGDAKHKFTKCVKELKGSSWLDDPDKPEGLCASMLDKAEPGWREGPRSGAVEPPAAPPKESKTTTHEAALRPVDKKVVDAFMNKQPAEGRILESDGKQLKTVGYMGSGAVIARWVDEDRISILEEYSSRTEQSAAQYLRKVVPRKLQDQHDYPAAYAAVENTAKTIVAVSPKSADRMIQQWAQGLPRDAAGHAGVWLYSVVKMDADADEWLQRAEHEGLYIPANQRDVPYVQEYLQEELNDKIAKKLDADTQAGRVGNFVYAEQYGSWGLMYETPAVEDVVQQLSQKPVKAEVNEAPTREARRTSRERRPRDRDSRAPAMQLTQQISRLPREKSKRKPREEEPEKESLLLRGLKWLDQKSHEAAVESSPWGRLRAAESIDKRDEPRQAGCGCRQPKETKMSRERNAAEQEVLPGTYEEIINVDPDWRSMGKFSHYADEVVYEWTLDGGGEALGDVDGFGYYELVEVPGGVMVQEPESYVGEDWTFASAIVHINSQGFVNVHYFDTVEEGRTTWEELEREYEEWLAESDDPEYF